jgi:hypothetical protein
MNDKLKLVAKKTYFKIIKNPLFLLSSLLFIGPFFSSTIGHFFISQNNMKFYMENIRLITIAILLSIVL